MTTLRHDEDPLCD